MFLKGKPCASPSSKPTSPGLLPLLPPPRTDAQRSHLPGSRVCADQGPIESHLSPGPSSGCDEDSRSLFIIHGGDHGRKLGVRWTWVQVPALHPTCYVTLGLSLPVSETQLLHHWYCGQQERLKTQQWPQDWKRSVFIPIPKKGNAKECSNYRTDALISHASKIMLKILQARLQQYMN